MKNFIAFTSIFSVLLNFGMASAEEAMTLDEGRTIRLETLALKKVSLCDDRNIPMYSITNSEENKFQMPDSCGKFYVQLQSDGVERALTAGSLFYPERIDPASYDRYKIWFASALTTDGGEPDGTTAFKERTVYDSTLDRSEIVTQYLGSEDKRSWLFYDIGISDYIGGTIVQFYSVPYLVREDLADEFFHGEELLDAQLLLKDARRWFSENAYLLARETDSLRCP